MWKIVICELSVSLFMLLSSVQSCGMTEANKVVVERIYAGSISIDTLAEIDGTNILIKKEIDLCRAVCNIPEGMTLCFKGGKIKNGKLVGNKTKIRYSGTIFDSVSIAGSWDVNEIKSSMFTDLSYPNALKDVMALASPHCKNKIVIEPGNYIVAASKNGDICLRTCSNTELVINGTIELIPNDYSNYYILQAEGENVVIKGKGTIIGDKHFHEGSKGEWGMGINIVNGHHVKISGLTIKDCWGDCIYIASRSRDIDISKCFLDHGRRQGISITSGRNIYIHNCNITNVGGTPPEYAIDIEPNEADTVSNVRIERVKIDHCVGGVMTTICGRDARSRVENVEIRRCQISTNGVDPLSITRCDTAVVSHNKIYTSNKTAIKLYQVGYVMLEKNTLNINTEGLLKLKNRVGSLASRDGFQSIKKIQCGTIEEKGNHVILR